jgi:hypothetical protein
MNQDIIKKLAAALIQAAASAKKDDSAYETDPETGETGESDPDEDGDSDGDDDGDNDGDADDADDKAKTPVNKHLFNNVLIEEMLKQQRTVKMPKQI